MKRRQITDRSQQLLRLLLLFFNRLKLLVSLFEFLADVSCTVILQSMSSITTNEDEKLLAIEKI